MNILVLSDFFRLGGLENHIITFYEATKAENRYCFCFGEYEDVGILKCDRIYSGFHFSFQATVAELIEDVERLLTIIREEKIDVIHVHPWYAIFPAYFAANIAEVKLVCTYHVTTSANFTCTVFDQIMYEEIISSSVSAIYCVNKYGIDTFSGMGEKNTCFLPNPVDLKQYEVSALPGNRKWALVSRIDSDKYPGVEKAIRMLPDLDIDQVDVYGDGNCFSQLEDLVKETSARVELKGFSPDMGKSLKGNYDGVIGVDRVAIEALTMGIPVLLAGYSKVCGLISQEDYPKLRQCNFVPIEFREKTPEEINAEIKDMYQNRDRYVFPEAVRKDYDVRELAGQYLRVLKNSDYKGGREYVKKFYHDLKRCETETFFHNSDFTWELAKKYLQPATNSMNVKRLFMLNDQLILKEKETAALRGRIDALEKNLMEADRKLGEADRKLSEVDRKLSETDWLMTELKRSIRKQVSDISSFTVQRNNMRILKAVLKEKLSRK